MTRLAANWPGCHADSKPSPMKRRIDEWLARNMTAL